ncbi:MAG: hypothetical protein LBF27_25665 [Sphingobacterium sp.]|jgi:hypothetical protein|nr:hypothetical protein [Sphingobacterium sp.]
MKREKEKAEKQAKELVKRFWMGNQTGQDSYPIAIANANIAVDEIIKAIAPIAEFRAQYWALVREELKNL